MLKVLIFLCLSSTALGQLEQTGTCTFSGVQTLTNVTNLKGNWIQYKRIQDQSDMGECSNLEVVLLSNGTLQLKSKSVNNKKVVTRSAIVTQSVPNMYEIKYDDGVEYNLAVVATDYINYCVLYGCKSLTNKTHVYGQVYVRNLNLSNDTRNAIESAITYEAFNSSTWHSVQHTTTACDVNGGMNLHLSSPILLIVGLILFKNV